MMGGYEEDQISELQALEAIYPDEITVINGQPPIKFAVTLIVNSPIDEDEEYKVTLMFTLIEQYPEVGPEVEIEELSECFEDIDREELTELIEKEISNNLNSVMAFPLISSVNEWLQEKSESLKERKFQDQERKKKELEAEEMKRFEGTRVTIETFMAWKRDFDAEMAELEKMNQKDEGASRKMTGRELFEKDKSMIESDLQFLDSEEDFCLDVGGDVKVNESLFQALDDIELDDEEDDEDE
ncbi:RWD domain-containing protein 1-like [Brevipalpus obovatus]|uniref:RWD domain-containing protein 1-like n=1 Tax=Brevipalpus obovatus TaxID=246614 RepID=UPI003D9E7918